MDTFAVIQIGYCQNDIDCRRALQLAHFGEMEFDVSSCKGTCDNCARMGNSGSVEEDVSETARQLVRLVGSTIECHNWYLFCEELWDKWFVQPL